MRKDPWRTRDKKKSQEHPGGRGKEKKRKKGEMEHREMGRGVGRAWGIGGEWEDGSRE